MHVQAELQVASCRALIPPGLFNCWYPFGLIPDVVTILQSTSRIEATCRSFTPESRISLIWLAVDTQSTDPQTGGQKHPLLTIFTVS